MDNLATPNIRDGRKTVTAAATAEALVASSTPAKQVTVTALESNTDAVVVGASTVVAGTTGDGGATRRGTPLFPTQSATFDIEDLSDVYVDAVVNGEGVSYTYQF